MTVYDKPFKTYEEQIDIMKSRNILINDINNAKTILSTSTYYELINGYKECFTISKDKFIDGISIEFLNEFYYFDHGFQNILFLHSVYVETSFKSCLSYVLAEKYGVDENNYLDKSKFKRPNSREQKNIFDNTFLNIKKVYIRDVNLIDEPTKHYKSKNHIPPWILLKNVSFSNSINLYSYLHPEEKIKVIELMIPEIFSYIDETNEGDIAQIQSLFKNSLTIIRKFRNKIAHNLKFYSYNSGNYKIKNKILKNTPYNIFFDKNEYNNPYSMIIAILLLEKDKITQGKLIKEIELYLNKEEVQPLLSKYFSITGIPYDILSKFKNYINHY